MECAAPVWNSHLKKKLVRKLKNIQKYVTNLVPEVQGEANELGPNDRRKKEQGGYDNI